MATVILSLTTTMFSTSSRATYVASMICFAAVIADAYMLDICRSVSHTTSVGVHSDAWLPIPHPMCRRQLAFSASRTHASMRCPESIGMRES
jgi:hypothetical protein